MKQFIINFARIYIFIFILDGIFSIIDDISLYFLSNHFFHNLANIIWIICLITGLLNLLLTNIFGILPKKVFWPISLFPFLYLIAFIPMVFLVRKLSNFGLPFNYFHILNSSYKMLFATISISFFQILLGLYAIRFLKNNDLTEKNLFVKKRFAGFIFFNFFSLLVITPLFLCINTFVFFNNISNGYVKPTLTGLKISEKIFRNKNKEIILVGLVKTENKQMYQNILAKYSKSDTLIIEEGITDSKSLLNKTEKYKLLTYALGLHNPEGNFGRNLKNCNLSHYDTEVNTFNTVTINNINAVINLINNSQNLIEFIKEFSNIKFFLKKDKAWQHFVTDFVIFRHQKLIRKILQETENYDRIVIIWGTLYIDELENLIKAENFKFSRSIKHHLSDYSNIFEIFLLNQ